MGSEFNSVVNNTGSRNCPVDMFLLNKMNVGQGFQCAQLESYFLPAVKLTGPVEANSSFFFLSFFFFFSDT